MIPTPRTLKDKWTAYRSQRPRSFDGSVVDEVALEREDALMDQFIIDLDALLAAEGTPPETDHGAELIGQTIPDVAETEPRLNKEIERLRFLMPLFFGGVDVILFRETIPTEQPITQWVAACEDYYAVAQGHTKEEALRAWKSTFIADSLLFMASGVERGPTPRDHWAEMSADRETIDESTGFNTQIIADDDNNARGKR